MAVSKSVLEQYEMVIGLEVHVELKTKTKIFCGCSTAFGAAPNTQCCPVCTGMPGALPVLNRKVVSYAVKAGMATNCRIAHYSKEDRKNYFYPDLPKAYQISQYDLPLCEQGYLDIETDAGVKRIGITRIHIEEDAGKLIHVEGKGTLIDCNRCGVPLIEIVSEPDIRSAAEARAYVQKLRAVMLYTGVSDCRMNEGSLRCDVNLSVRKKGDQRLGTRTEMKNINSFQFILKAIEYEFARQIEVIENGGTITQETRRYDQESGKTFSMRSKEDADDYRYFPDPDLPPIILNDNRLEELRGEIPVLPDERKKHYMERYGLTSFAAEQITSRLETAEYFEKAAARTDYPKLAASLLQAELLAKIGDEEDIPVKPERLAAVTMLLGKGTINNATARTVLELLREQDADPEEIVEQRGLKQINDRAALLKLAEEAIAADPKSVAAYLGGKLAAAQAIIGRMMKLTSGRGNPVMIREIVLERLEQLKA